MSETGKTFKEKLEAHKKLVEHNNKVDASIRLNGNIIIQAKAKAKVKPESGPAPAKASSARSSPKVKSK